MDKVEKFLEVKLMPVGERLANNRYLQALKNAFVMFSPFLIVGSIFLLISSFPIPAYQEFMTNVFGDTWQAVIEIPFNASYAFMALFLTFLVGYNYALIEDVDPISSGLLSTIVLLILTPLTDAGEEIGTVLSLDWMGSNGIFVGFLAAFTTVNVFKIFIRRDFVIKMPEQVPPEVARSFSAIIPATVIMILALVVRMFFEATQFDTIHAFIFGVIAIPIGAFGTSYFGSLLYSISLTGLWSVGINSGSMINGILRPFWLNNQMDNIAALQAGLPLPHVITEQFFDMIWMGGSGVTLGLLIAMIATSKSRQNKAISKLALAPGLFNINEPVLFGLPVILNPIMLIPFNIVPLVLITTQFIAMDLNIVARPTGVVIPWTTPPVISGFLITGSITGSLMQIVNLLIAAAIYYPFLRIIDKQNFKEEQGSDADYEQQ